MRVLVACASKHGSTEGISEAIAERLSQLGHDTVAIRVLDVPISMVSRRSCWEARSTPDHG